MTGRKKATRKKLTPRILRFNKSATIKDKMMTPGTYIAANCVVMRSDFKKVRSLTKSK